MTLAIYRHDGSGYEEVATFEDGEVLSGRDEIPRTADAIEGLTEEEVIQQLDSFKLVAVKQGSNTEKSSSGPQVIDLDEDSSTAPDSFYNSEELPADLRDKDLDFDRLRDELATAYRKQVWEDDLEKAPLMWRDDSEVPDFVQRWVGDVIERTNPFWGQGYDGVPDAATSKIHRIIADDLTQAQGWSIKSIMESLMDEFEWMDAEQADTIVRSEVAAVLNKSREVAYRAEPDEDQKVFGWVGPDDNDTTDMCKEIKERIEERGGAVPLHILKDILLEVARDYKAQGGTPERVDQYVPHYKCRHTLEEKELDEVR